MLPIYELLPCFCRAGKEIPGVNYHSRRQSSHGCLSSQSRNLPRSTIIREPMWIVGKPGLCISVYAFALEIPRKSATSFAFITTGTTSIVVIVSLSLAILFYLAIFRIRQSCCVFVVCQPSCLSEQVLYSSVVCIVFVPSPFCCRDRMPVLSLSRL